MNREIKFRAYDLTLNRWVVGWLVGDYIIDLYDFETSYEDIDVKSIGQYTGLKDKNGKEIYEGDICKTHRFVFQNGSEIDDNDILEVGYIEANMSFGFFDRYLVNESVTPKEIYIDYWEFSDDGIEVIGNIHDNPELLK